MTDQGGEPGRGEIARVSEKEVEEVDPLSGREYCPRCGSGPRQAQDVDECPDCGRQWAGPPLLSLGKATPGADGSA